MGFVIILKFAVKCMDVVAWPLLALVYPLCASIRAIEIDSSSDPRKLVAYWILFSLIFIFEHAFGKLLQWVPFWPYIKLIFTCWLVIPDFDGASYVYENFLRPCLPMNTKVLSSQSKERKEFFLKRSNFAAEVKTYVKKNGPEALQVASQVQVQRANFAEKAEELAEKNNAAAEKQVNQTEPGRRTQLDYKKLAPEKIEEISGSEAAVGDFSEIPDSMKVQKEWTCGICQVTTQSEITLNSHLRGRRHQAACEELNAKNQPPKTKVPPAANNKKSASPAKWEPENQPQKTKVPPVSNNKKSASPAVQEPGNRAASEELHVKNQPSKTKVPPASNNKKSGSTAVQEPENHASTSRSTRKRKMLEGQQENHKQPLWWCNLCNRSCNSKHDLDCHLSGRKHLAQVAQLKGSSLYVPKSVTLQE